MNLKLCSVFHNINQVLKKSDEGFFFHVENDVQWVCVTGVAKLPISRLPK